MPLYLGNSTIEAIGLYEALAAQPGVLQAVSVVQEPIKKEYITGETIDPTGLILNVTIDGNTYQIGPEGTGDGTDKYIKVNATMGGAPLNASEFTGVTVQPWVSLNNEDVQSSNGFFISISEGPAADTVLENNSWETIAQIAAAGKAQEYWNVGDTKTITVNGENLLMTIMGFDHYTLSTSDTKYGDTTYNNGTNKAGITFMATTISTDSQILFSSDSSAKYNYGYSDIKTYLEGTLINKFPFATELMRKVSIGYYGSNYPASNIDKQSDYMSLSSDHKLFVPGYKELGGTNINISNQTKFAYIAANNIPDWKWPHGATITYDICLRDVCYGTSAEYPWGSCVVMLDYDDGNPTYTGSQSADVSGCYSFIFNF